MSDAARHAIYFTPPPGSPLAAFGARVFGEDGPGTPALLPEAWIAEPLRYGFHATLKAPFRLAPDRDAGALAAALDAFCAGYPPVSLGALRPVALGRFVALVPASGGDPQTAPVAGLAAECVRRFDPFRAPLTEAERAHRRPERLTPRQRDLLKQWGYPHVFEEFRFHMTLTGPLDGDVRAQALARLVEAYAPLAAEPVTVDALSLLEQPLPSQRFRLVDRYRLRGGAR